MVTLHAIDDGSGPWTIQRLDTRRCVVGWGLLSTVMALHDADPWQGKAALIVHSDRMEVFAVAVGDQSGERYSIRLFDAMPAFLPCHWHPGRSLERIAPGFGESAYRSVFMPW